MSNATRTPKMRSANTYWLSNLVGQGAINLFLLALSLACLLPFVVILAASFSTENSIVNQGYSLLPKDFNTLAYQYLLVDSAQVLQSYLVSVTITTIGAPLGLLIMALVAYAMTRKHFQYRKAVAFYIFFTMLFSGGLVPSYILITQYLQLKDTLAVLIVPSLVVGGWVLILRTYFRDLPEELLDAARIDGSGEWRTFFQIVVPLSTPGLATVGLFSMLMYWNDWFTSLLYIEKTALFPIQYLLYTIVNNMDFLDLLSQQAGVRVDPPRIPARMAMVVLAIGPILLAYPFVQRYFVRGIRVGSLKE
ncbi:MAG: carbohydrate ABC transporter permease [Chloroflexi bacterium]|nr:carbohydrate ABC transporter permease [Chloroflexota bacterium]